MYSGRSRRNVSQARTQNEADDPVLHHRKGENFPIAKDVAELVVVHFGQRRVMRIRPIAIGTEVVPILRLSKTVFTPGSIAPMAMPVAIARKIQSVRSLSRKESRRRGATEATVRRS